MSNPTSPQATRQALEQTTNSSEEHAAMLAEATIHFSPTAEIKIIRRYNNYFGGTLFQLSIAENNNTVTGFAHNGKSIEFFDSFNDVVVWTKNQKYQIFRTIDPLLLVPSFIAVMITSIIGWYAIEGKGDAPAYLANAMATILGFYFGRSTLKS